MLYRLIASIRNRLYDKGTKQSFEAEVPTVCVGNITVGGTGKTPHTEMILRTLLSDDDWCMSNIAVLSRGYKRKSKGFQLVQTDSGAALAGDEPLQIKKKFPVVTVAVDKDRIEGCRRLCHPEGDVPPSDLIILDDAFQYRKLRARVNIILVDYNRPLGKDVFLPFGRLRDLPSRIGEADIVIVTKCPYDLLDEERTEFMKDIDLKDFDPATGYATGKGGKRVVVLFTRVEYEKLQTVFPESDPRYEYSKKMILFSGIAKDGPLMTRLGANYKVVRRFSFPDHHRFTKGDMSSIASAIQDFPIAGVVTTEKDAQRVLDCKCVPAAVRERLLCLPIRVEFLTEREETLFRETLKAALGKESPLV